MSNSLFSTPPATPGSFIPPPIQPEPAALGLVMYGSSSKPAFTIFEDATAYTARRPFTFVSHAAKAAFIARNPSHIPISPWSHQNPTHAPRHLSEADMFKRGPWSHPVPKFTLLRNMEQMVRNMSGLDMWVMHEDRYTTRYNGKGEKLPYTLDDLAMRAQLKLEAEVEALDDFGELPFALHCQDYDCTCADGLDWRCYSQVVQSYLRET